MTYPDLHMISWRRYGYRMIGTGDRFELARARYMGQGLDLSSSQYHRAGTSTTTGESTTYSPPPPPPPPPVHKVIQLHLNNPPPAPPPVQHIPQAVTAVALPVVQTLPVRTLAAANPVCPPCPQCPPEPNKLALAGGGALVAGLIMYFVGLSTKERRKRGRG
jgi:hypothetical protein